METQSMVSSQCSVINEEEEKLDFEEEEEPWGEREYMLARAVWNKWRDHHFTSLRDDLWGNAIFLKEANAISVELKKEVVFQFVLVTDSLLSPITSELLLYTDKDKPKSTRKKTIVCVKVSDLKNGATHLWSLAKLRKRLEIMRKMYDQACDLTKDSNCRCKGNDPLQDKIPWFKAVGNWHSKLTKRMRPNDLNMGRFPTPNFNLSCIHHNPGDLTPPCYSPTVGMTPSVSILSLPSVMSPQLSPTSEVGKKVTSPSVIRSCSMSDIDYESAIYNLLSHQDPFYDRTPWFTIIGRGFAYLSNLLVPVPLVHKMAIISEEGKLEGHLRIAVHPFFENGENQHDAENNNTMKYNSRRSSATAHLKFPEKQSDIFTNIKEYDDIDTRSDIRYVEGKGESSAETSLMDDPPGSKFQSMSFDSAPLQPNDNLDMNSNKLIPDAVSFINSSVNHLKIGSKLKFRVTILDAVGISTDYADIFCQFNFLNRQGDSFSTEPLRNTGTTPLAFYHVQNFSVEVTKSFLDYICTEPLVFEVFGHFSQHPLHDHSKTNVELLMHKSPSTFSVSPLSRPVPATAVENCNLLAASGVHTHASYDMLIWFEICELEPNGEYTPAMVDHSNDEFGAGSFLLHQGIQRRLTITISHESGAELEWKEVKEIVVGRIRNKKEECNPMQADDVLTLCLLPAQYVHPPNHDRTFFRFEGAWDSSLHNSNLLNRVTPNGERIYITVSAYVELENCSQPIVISKDLELIICQRDAKIRSSRSLKNLFTGNTNSLDMNRVSGVYEVSLKYNEGGAGSPGMRRRRRRVVDTSTTYVRGEENLSGWRPRSDSLILEHQAQLRKFQKIMQVEKTRHMLLLHDIMKQQGKKENEVYDGDSDEGDNNSVFSELEEETEIGEKPPIEENKLTVEENKGFGSTLHSSAVDEDETVCESKECDISKITNEDEIFHSEYGDIEEMEDDQDEDDEKEKQLATKCLRLMKYRIPSIFDFQDQTQEIYLNNDSGVGDEYLNVLSPSTSKNTIPRTTTESSCFETCSYGSSASTPDQHEKQWKLAQYIPTLSEIRVSPIASRKGYLNMLEPNTSYWSNRWVVVRRPYVFLYSNHRDPTPRDSFNLACTSVKFSLNQDGVLKVPYTFGICTEHRGFLLQATNESDLHGWLYAFDPLMAGSIRSKLARRNVVIKT